MSEEESVDFVKFWQKVRAVTDPGLTDSERDLVHAGLFLAWILTTRASELEKGFEGSFTPDQVAVLKEYGPGTDASVHFVPGLVAQFSSIQSAGDSIRSHTSIQPAGDSIRSHTTP
ncbi:hypothetical protein [Amycolatopsis sp. NPDC051061]|uniref:hypothetical protein n=1 Tax=Amycolatopsis sp. NPDC051061 TaxID=3155042 RepID=UPI0034440ECA